MTNNNGAKVYGLFQSRPVEFFGYTLVAKPRREFIERADSDSDSVAIELPIVIEIHKGRRIIGYCTVESVFAGEDFYPLNSFDLSPVDKYGDSLDLNFDFVGMSEANTACADLCTQCHQAALDEIRRLERIYRMK